jgi:MFS family permease
MRFFGFTFKRDVHRVQLSQALHSVALSFVGIYVPVFLLVHGFSLSEMILFFVFFHVVGLVFGLTVNPWLMQRFGFAPTLRFSFPIQIFYFILLNLLPLYSIPWMFIASIGGIANILYWMPLNILLVKHADKKKMGSDLGTFFALPKIFGIAGPIISAILIPFFGFLPMFLVAGFGLIVSYLPLYGIRNGETMPEFRLRRAWQEIRKRKSLFFLEGLDNVIEESEWFWGIFVFLSIGSLSVPGIVGGLESLGGALFALVAGRFSNRYADKLVPISSMLLVAVWGARFFIRDPLSAYAASFVASFVMTLFLVSYFGMIFGKIKGDGEEAFLILREIPTTIGRLILFGVILLSASDPVQTFFLPIITIVVLLLVLFVKRNRFVTAPVVLE